MEGGMGGTIVVGKEDGKLYGLTNYYSLHNWCAEATAEFDI